MWQIAESTMEKIKNGDIPASNQQIKRLNDLIEAHRAQLEAETEAKRILIGVIFERYIYHSKLTYLEKLGVKNSWKPKILQEIKDILYDENETFEVTDFAGSTA